jgi:prophage antirepressor-like protein
MTPNELALTFEAMQVRMVIRDGDPWWVLADVCAVLQHSNSRMMAEALDADEKGVSIVDTLGGRQEMVIVSEPGLYKILMTSRKPEAKRFDRWIRHEVLPSIRKTGMYGSPSLVPPAPIQAISDLFDQKLEPVVREMAVMREDIKRVDDNVVRLVTKGRRYATADTLRIHSKVIRYHFFKKCPCGECDIIIMDESGFISGRWEHHHQNNNWDNRPTAMIPLAIECHKRIESDADARTRFSARGWLLFQTLLSKLEPKQLRLEV